MGTLLHGVDFTSAPSRRKPITVADGRIDAGRGGAVLHLERIEALPELDAFDRWLRRPGPWLAACDFPFGLPRALLAELGWPHRPGRGESAWAASIRHLAAMSRDRMIAQFRAYCDARPAGSKFARRATDRPAGSSPSMKWVNPPVALMLHAGAPRLLASGVDLPGLHPGDPRRVVLEGYPGYVARALVGRRSYKADDRARQTPDRREAREAMIARLERGDHAFGLPLALDAAHRRACIEDPAGDLLDAVLCLVQAAWGWRRRARRYGLPDAIDPVEGWIVSVPAESTRAP
ncbi:MAG: DUF429 domain-containing protein [Burkholderiaceae bacterium]|nr:DUF429 domain-containing protein [Burkholderiaceae bacterium]HMN63779.1 DUF429 domain-containing protein [Burkholderiaceae bacterium]